MADFTKAFIKTMGAEGGYSNDPNDPGGETIYGIARTKNADWDGWVLLDAFKKDPSNFPKNALADSAIQSQVKAFYKKKYWDIHHLDAMDSQDIASEIFDSAVNIGNGKEASFLITALNLLNRQAKDYTDIPYGTVIEIAHVAMVNNHKRPQNILKCLNGLQFMHYYNITKADPKFEIYFNGWLNRV